VKFATQVLAKWFGPSHDLQADRLKSAH